MVIRYKFGNEYYDYHAPDKEVEKVLTPILMAKLDKLRSTIEHMLDDEMYFEQMCDEYKDVLESWFSDDAEKEYEEMLNELDDEEYYPYYERRVML